MKARFRTRIKYNGEFFRAGELIEISEPEREFVEKAGGEIIDDSPPENLPKPKQPEAPTTEPEPPEQKTETKPKRRKPAKNRKD